MREKFITGWKMQRHSALRFDEKWEHEIEPSFFFLLIVPMSKSHCQKVVRTFLDMMLCQRRQTKPYQCCGKPSSVCESRSLKIIFHFLRVSLWIVLSLVPCLGEAGLSSRLENDSTTDKTFAVCDYIGTEPNCQVCSHGTRSIMFIPSGEIHTPPCPKSQTHHHHPPPYYSCPLSPRVDCQMWDTPPRFPW